MIPLEILQQASKEELAHAATCLVEEHYLATVTDWNSKFIGGQMHGGIETYDIVIADTRVYCSCPASRFQKTRCKHVVMFALSCLRAVQLESETTEVRELVAA